jgi:hypothetical protein
MMSVRINDQNMALVQFSKAKEGLVEVSDMYALEMGTDEDPKNESLEGRRTGCVTGNELGVEPKAIAPAIVFGSHIQPSFPLSLSLIHHLLSHFFYFNQLTPYSIL